jgi:hypothetical protein
MPSFGSGFDSSYSVFESEALDKIFLACRCLLRGIGRDRGLKNQIMDDRKAEEFKKNRKT